MNDIFTRYCLWPATTPIQEKGFVVAADISQEWLLPWWWNKYSQHNDLPVAFVDFGLSLEMKDWCKQKGIYIPLPVPDLFVKEKDAFSLDHVKMWEEKHNTFFWNSRGAWFKKPLACLQTPYELSVWMDLDCEVLANLDDIFSLSLPPSGVFIAKDSELGGVNSGVILFKKKAKLIEDWAKDSFQKNDLFVGDQDVLYSIIKEKEILIGDLSRLYNWSRIGPPNPDARILHWHGQYGKITIQHQIFKEQLKETGLLS
jgi:hypothetical protein